MKFKEILNRLKGEKKFILGKDTKDKVYCSENKFSTAEKASTEFNRSVEKLFNVNQWSQMPGISSGFSLYNSHGKKKDAAKPEIRDFIKIDLPGPAPEVWVVVIGVQEEEKLAEFTVSPSVNPTNKDEDKVEHFFIDEATSTFRVELLDKTIKACEVGKNEGINKADKDENIRKLINIVMAEGGWAGFQKFQWNKLTEFIVHKVELGND
ncbi:hypothetical protein [Autumnicola musiva]|uniref:Uncharacterized protein n=1 Tax=Autumnicola musiva TaxID=3075589 RepID=A0ABU3D729_9FLAO|nr:hypothetical protein [Zunongwangia sp. F117]MDT0677179.1 hypothetical protein [Zunongwangia sp. F117]